MAVKRYRKDFFFIASALALTALMLGGCVHNKPFRTTAPSAAVTCSTSTHDGGCSTLAYHDISPGNTKGAGSVSRAAPSIGYIEFDDQGQLFNRPLAFQVLKVIRETARKEKVAIVLFAHGWKHNASSDDSNVSSFQELLVETDSLINRNRGPLSKPRRVIGVYVGWRGLSAQWEPMKSMTFWGRKNTSVTVGDEGLMEVIAELSQMRAENPGTTTLTLSGHSFGGQMVFHATKNLLMKELVDRQHRKDHVSGSYEDFQSQTSNGDKSFHSSIADFILIVNPAIETLRYSNLQDRLAMSRFDREQTPIFAVFMSKADAATRTLFPAGRLMSTLFESYRTVNVPSTSDSGMGVSQRKLDRAALGHHATSITHQLHRAPEEGRQQNASGTTLSPESEACFQWGQYIRQTVINGIKVDRWVGGGLELKRLNRPGSDPHSPYMIVSVDGGLIKDHSDIWGDEFTSFIATLIRSKGLGLECVYKP